MYNKTKKQASLDLIVNEVLGFVYDFEQQEDYMDAISQFIPVEDEEEYHLSDELDAEAELDFDQDQAREEDYGEVEYIEDELEPLPLM